MWYRFAFLTLMICVPKPASAEGNRNFYGSRGLNTIPDARFDDKGTINLTLSHADPYTNAAFGFQFTDNLYIALRQSAETSNPLDSADTLYPGIDTKIKLWDESAYHPQAALGLQSAFGHKRFAGEYLALSKRWKAFDFTSGLGWGRFAGGAHFSNPLKVISHFDKEREIDGDIANDPSDWFTGEHIGLFGGFSYDLPIEKLSFTADWNGDPYDAEKLSSDYDPPSPWSIGLQYHPQDFISAGVGLLGTDKIIGRITLSPHIPDWPLKMAKPDPLPSYPPLRPERGKSHKILTDAGADGQRLRIIKENEAEIHTDLSLEEFGATPSQIKRAVHYMSRNAPAHIGSFKITPRFAGLQGASIKLIRRDLEQAYAEKRGSPEEIWQNAEFDSALTSIPFKGLNKGGLWPEKIILEQQISLSEEDQGILSRTSLIIEEQRELIGSLATGAALRFDLTNNLDDLNRFRPRSVLPVRSDIDHFAERTISLDRFYLSYLKTIKPDLHVNVTGGYLEEQYAGLGGEILYRPFRKNWAVGADAWQVFKRDPFTSLNQGLTVDSLLTGHMNAWYKLPKSPETTLNLKLGRYLAEDVGGSFGLKHQFKNGASLEGHVTLSDMTDLDVYGGNTNLHHGVKLSLPIGSLDYIPRNSRIDMIAAPFGRDAGQALDKPIDLYDMTDAFSLQHLAMNWSDMTD